MCCNELHGVESDSGDCCREIDIDNSTGDVFRKGPRDAEEGGVIDKQRQSRFERFSDEIRLRQDHKGPDRVHNSADEWTKHFQHSMMVRAASESQQRRSSKFMQASAPDTY